MSITASINIPKEARVLEFSCEVLPSENLLIKGVQYQNISGAISIVDSISRKIIFRLSNNPNAFEIKGNPDLGLAYFIKSESPGNEMASVYRIDTNTNYVYKISHLRIKYHDPIAFEGGIVEKYLLGATPESYENMIQYLKRYRSDSIEGLIVKVNEDWISLSEISPSQVLPIEENNDTEEK